MRITVDPNDPQAVEQIKALVRKAYPNITLRPKGCEETDCGYTDGGLQVQAITDGSGSHVVVTNDLRPHDNSLLSKALATHKMAIRLGNMVAQRGISAYQNWQGPLGSC